MTAGLDFKIIWKWEDSQGRDDTSHPMLIIVITEGGGCLQGLGLVALVLVYLKFLVTKTYKIKRGW